MRIFKLLLLLFICGCVSSSPFAGVKNLYEAQGSTLVCFGDSITAGSGADILESYPRRLQDQVKLTVINAGVAGDTTASAFRRLEEEVLLYQPRIVIVELGGNDYIRRVPPSETFDNLSRIIDKIQEKRAIVMLLVVPLGSNYEDAYKRLGRQKGCLVIEDLLQEIFEDKTLMTDELHPNALGYKLMAERIAGTLKELLMVAAGD
jgi:lysophospholipase L1-like esterase